MAENSVQVELSIDEQKALRALTALTKKIDDFGKDVVKSINKSDVAFAAFAGTIASAALSKSISFISNKFSDFTGFIEDSVKAAAHAEASLNSLKFALASSGIASEQTIKNFEDLASQIQKTTKYEDDAVIANIALIQSLARLDEQGLKRATFAATNFATALGIDLESASRILGKASEGNTIALSKLGIEFKKGGTDGETFANVLTTIEKRFGGAAINESKTFAGAIAQIGNVYSDLKEKIGGLITQNPAIIAAFNVLKSVFIKTGEAIIEAFKGGNADAIANLFRLLIDGTAAVVLTADAIGRSFSFAVESVMSSIRTMALGIVTPIAGILELAASIPKVGEAFRGAADFATAEMNRLSGAVEKNLAGISDAVSGETAFGKIADNIAEARGEFDFYYNQVKSKAPELKNALAGSGVDSELVEKRKAFDAQILDLDNQLALQRNQIAYENDLANKERVLARNEEEITTLNEFELTKSELIYQNQLNQNALLKTAEETRYANTKALKEKELRDAAVNKKLSDDLRKKEITDQQAFFSAAISLSDSKSKELAAIGKAAALFELSIKAPQAVASSFAYGSTIGGPPLGFVFGAIAATAMAAQAAKIAGIGGFADGGIVGGNSLSGDKLTANVNSGEMILNQGQQKQLFDIANGKSSSSNILDAINSLGERIQNMTIVVQADGREIARVVRDQKLAGFVL